MLLKYFYDDKLAQASYLVGCPDCGTAIVIDPARDIRSYLQTAEQHGLTIEFVTETHIHADFLSGTRELAHATGATMLLSAEGGDAWQYQFPDDNIRLIKDGDSFMVGGVKFDVIHTAGHTPEHISLMVTDSHADKPMALFSGDFLFAGDVGRPDLLEEVAGQANTREIGAKQQFANVQRFKQMPDYLQVLPGHGAGSACGKALGAVPSTTLGYEKLFNPAFQIDDEADFVNWLLDGQPEAPHYFAHMKKVNKEAPTLISDLDAPQNLDTLPEPLENLVIDTRTPQAFRDGHVKNTVNIPISSNSFATYAGWYVDFDTPLYLIVEGDKLEESLLALRAIGVDKVAGYITVDKLNLTETVTEMTSQDIHEAGIQILDVRGIDEYKSEHIPDVIHIHMGKVPQRLADVPRDAPLAIQCGGGLRSQIVLSILEREGFTNLINLAGGIGAWKEADLPLVQA